MCPNGQLFVDMQNGPDLLVGSVEQLNADLQIPGPKKEMLIQSGQQLNPNASATDEDVR